jgi:hypothetical protein
MGAPQISHSRIIAFRFIAEFPPSSVFLDHSDDYQTAVDFNHAPAAIPVHRLSRYGVAPKTSRFAMFDNPPIADHILDVRGVNFPLFHSQLGMMAKLHDAIAPKFFDT